MTRLNLQDYAFLRLESEERPFHIAGLALCTPPKNADDNYLRDLSNRLRRLPVAFPVFARKLSDPAALGVQSWVDADDYDADYHIFHYALPAPGRPEDLVRILSRVHERMLDRSRPLWEIHLIEGLEGRRFAFYCKFHHALMDGVGALHMIQRLFDTDPETPLKLGKKRRSEKSVAGQRSVGQRLRRLGSTMAEQSHAIPELYGLLGQMGLRGWREGTTAPPLPFTAPHALFNQQITDHRRLLMTNLPLRSVRRIGAARGGTINDALLAICGGALREYLLAQQALPERSLSAGVPVSVEPSGEHEGNQLSTLICPFATDIDDPVVRLERIVGTTRQAKDDLQHLSRAASQDYMNLLLLPGIALTLSGGATLIPPPFNVIMSNVPGPREQLYFNGASVDSLYPLSLVSDAQALNITALSYRKRLCIGIVACPSLLPDIDTLPRLIRRAHRQLRDSL